MHPFFSLFVFESTLKMSPDRQSPPDIKKKKKRKPKETLGFLLSLFDVFTET